MRASKKNTTAKQTNTNMKNIEYVKGKNTEKYTKKERYKHSGKG